MSEIKALLIAFGVSEENADYVIDTYRNSAKASRCVDTLRAHGIISDLQAQDLEREIRQRLTRQTGIQVTFY